MAPSSIVKPAQIDLRGGILIRGNATARPLHFESRGFQKSAAVRGDSFNGDVR
jgi:hypothetical protein